MRTELDHLAILSPDLREGGVFCQTRLGFTPAVGGAHPDMGTHNLLTAFDAKTYLEVIAVDPTAPAPEHPRWFGLDTPPERSRLGTIILRTTDLGAVLEEAKILGLDFGRPVALSRGNLSWQMALREDGTLPMDGIGPLFIQWDGGFPPALNIQNDGLKLSALALDHPKAESLQTLMARINFIGAMPRIQPGEPGLSALLEAKDGRRIAL